MNLIKASLMYVLLKIVRKLIDIVVMNTLSGNLEYLFLIDKENYDNLTLVVSIKS